MLLSEIPGARLRGSDGGKSCSFRWVIRRRVAEHDLLSRTFFLYRFLEKGTHAGRVWEVGGGFNPNRFIETLKIGGIIARGCLWIWNKVSSSHDLSNSNKGSQSSCVLQLCSQKSTDGCVWSYRYARLKCKTKYELNIIWHPLKATRGGFSTFKISPESVVGGVNVARAGNEKREKKEGWETCFSQKPVTENGKASFRFSALLQSHTGNPPRPWKRNTLALL